MKLDDLLLSHKEFSLVDMIAQHCAQFIYQSNGIPLFKNLPKIYEDFHKVKVRKRKGDAVATPFNEAFSDNHYHLRQRALFANGIVSLEEASADTEPFFVFPIDGYKFLYSKTVQNSNDDYRKSFTHILESIGDKKGTEVIKDLLQFTYVDNEELAEGIESGAEIIIYNIPYFFAARTSVFNGYEDILEHLK